VGSQEERLLVESLGEGEGTKLERGRHQDLDFRSSFIHSSVGSSEFQIVSDLTTEKRHSDFFLFPMPCLRSAS
jgi:hypothetical protein